MGERKISNATAGLMIAVAFLLDLLNIGVDFITFGIGGVLIDVIATIIFGIWFSHLGASLWSSRNAGRTMLAIILDAFPVTDLAFPWTIQVAFTALTERKPPTPATENLKSRIRPTSGWRL